MKIRTLLSWLLKTFWGIFFATILFLVVALVFGAPIVRLFIPNWPCNKLPKWNIPNVESAIFDDARGLIIFSMDHPKMGGIFTMTKEGSVARWLRRNQGSTSYTQPSISPDGKKMVYVEESELSSRRLRVMDLDSFVDKPLTATSSYDMYPNFAPDNKTVFFVRALDWGNVLPVGLSNLDHKGIVSINIDSLEEVSITENKYIYLAAPQAMADGKSLLFFLSDPTIYLSDGFAAQYRAQRKKFNLWTIRIDNPSDATPIAPEISGLKDYYDLLYNPVLSKDGRYMLFTYPSHLTRSYRGEIYLHSFHDGKAKPIVSVGTTALIPQSISTKSGLILFTHDLYIPPKEYMYASNLWICNMDGTGLRNFVLDVSALYDRKLLNQLP